MVPGVSRWALCLALFVGASGRASARAPAVPRSPPPLDVAELILQKRPQIQAIDEYLAATLKGEAPPLLARSPKLGLLPGHRAEWLSTERAGGSSYVERSWDPSESGGLLRPFIIGGEIYDGPEPDAESVGLLRLDGKLHCTATLVAPRMLLTAAHCVAGRDAADLIQRGRLKFHTGVRGGGLAIGIAAVRPHPEYRLKEEPFSLEHDIALAVLEKDAGVPHLSIPAGDITSRLAAEELRFVGYGATGWAGRYLGGGTRMSVAMRVRPEPLRFRYGSKERGTCGGDSGGPALLRGGPGGRTIVAGVTSYGESAVCDREAVDTRTDAHLDFLHPQGL